MPVCTEAECLKAIDRIHETTKKIKTIIVTSGIFADNNELFYCYVSNNNQKYRFEIPIVCGQFVGTGDVFTSLLVVWLNIFNGDVCKAVLNVISSMQSLLKRTSKECFGTFFFYLT